MFSSQVNVEKWWVFVKHQYRFKSMSHMDLYFTKMSYYYSPTILTPGTFYFILHQSKNKFLLSVDHELFITWKWTNLFYWKIFFLFTSTVCYWGFKGQPKNKLINQFICYFHLLYSESYYLSLNGDFPICSWLYDLYEVIS